MLVWAAVGRERQVEPSPPPPPYRPAQCDGGRGKVRLHLACWTSRYHNIPVREIGREGEMAYKYQYNPAATDNVSLHDNTRGRTAGSLTYRSTRLVSVCWRVHLSFEKNSGSYQLVNSQFLIFSLRLYHDLVARLFVIKLSVLSSTASCLKVSTSTPPSVAV